MQSGLCILSCDFNQAWIMLIRLKTQKGTLIRKVLGICEYISTHIKS